MNDAEQQNSDFEEDEYVQITDLDPARSRPKGPVENVILILHKGMATPWIRYTLLSLLLVILLGTIFLQTYRPAPATSPVATKVGGTSSMSSLGVQFGDDQVYMQASDGTLTAYQDENGRTLWHAKLPEQASLQTFGQALYAYYATTQGKGMVEALNGKDGHVIWQQIIFAPGTNVALQQTGDALYAADSSDTIYAFQASNGHLRWTYRDGPYQVALPIGNLLQMQGGIAEVLKDDHSLDLLSANDGQKIAQVPPDDSGNSKQIVVDGQLIYAMGNSETVSLKQSVQVFRISDGKRLGSWTSRLTNPAEIILEQDNRVIEQVGGIIGMSGNAPALTALRGSDGHILWTYRASDNRAIITTYLEEDGTIYLVLQDSTLVHLRANDGQPLWSTPIKINSQQFNNSYPFLDHGIVFLLGASDTTSQAAPVYALRASDGKILWHASLLGNPSFQSGILYMMQTDGRLDAWRESDGGHLWSYQASEEMSTFENPPGKNNLVFLTDLLGNLEVLRANDGKLLWHN